MTSAVRTARMYQSMDSGRVYFEGTSTRIFHWVFHQQNDGIIRGSLGMMRSMME